MSAISFIRRFIYRLPEGETFTTRDCLAFGFRSAVDRALSRLVKKGTIRRLARGIFARDPDCRRNFSDFEIAKLKAEAFGRKIVKHPFTVAIELGIISNGQAETVFSIDGYTSKFRIGDRTIHFKQISSRKMRLIKSKSGQAMCALWHLGKHLVTGVVVTKALSKFDRLDMIELRRNMRWMPAWLSDSFKFTRRWEFVQAS
jgi:hypothetical protein